MKYDVIIVGARCAGSPLAMLLARQGHSVLVLDRARFPSNTLSTHFVQPSGVVRLNEWGLLEALVDAGTPQIFKTVFQAGGFQVETSLDPTPILPFGMAPRRLVLDEILVAAARRAGAEVLEGVSLESLIRENGTVLGVRGRKADGETLEASAKMVVGADGRHSKVAELIEAPFTEYVDPVSCGYFGYWDGDFEPSTEFRIFENKTLISFPTNGSHVVIALWDVKRFREIRKDPISHLATAYDEIPHMAEAIRSGEPVENISGTADVPNFVRKAWGPGWALTGDAVYHKDPTPADGMSDAFRSAEQLSFALHKWLSGGSDMEEAMVEYEDRILQASSENLPLTVKLSSLSFDPSERGGAFMQLSAARGLEMQELSERWVRGRETR